MQTPSRESLLIQLPALAIIPLLGAKLPSPIGVEREIAGYFQALAIVRTGVNSFFFLTPEESFSALHFHSLLASPLIAGGYIEAGRLVSLLAATVAVGIVTHVGTRLFNARAGLFAGALLWASPNFITRAWLFQPETLSIALIVGAVATVLKHVEAKHNWWFGATVALLIAAMATHMWEMSILLPLVAVLAFERQFKQAALLIGIAVAWAGLIHVIVGLQPQGQATLLKQSVLSVGMDVYFSAEYWFAHVTLYDSVPIPRPRGVATTISLLGAVVAAVYWLRRTWDTPSRRAVLLGAWLVSSLSIPIVLARGYMIHSYYVWATFAPLAITGGLGADMVSRRLAGRLGHNWSLHQVTRGGLVLVVAIAIVFVLTFQVGIFFQTDIPGVSRLSPVPQPHQPSVQQAAADLRSDPVAADEIVFAGDFDNDYSGRAGQILIYSDILVRNRVMSAADGPKLLDNSRLSCAE